MQTISISQYISKLANLSKFDTKIERLALEIAKKTENHLLSDGKSPNGIAAAYLYLIINTTRNKYITNGYI